MNENFIEEENTIYEIDPDCQIEHGKEEQNRWQSQSCLEAKKIRSKKNNGNCLLLLILFLCYRNLK